VKGELGVAAEVRWGSKTKEVGKSKVCALHSEVEDRLGHMRKARTPEID